MPTALPGVTVSCKGEWKQHIVHGRQFIVGEYQIKAPADVHWDQKISRIWFDQGYWSCLRGAYCRNIRYRNIRYHRTRTLKGF